MLRKSHSLKWFKPGRVVKVNDRMQRNYSYALDAPAGKSFDPQFKPQVSPGRMLAMGVFEGKYMNDCVREFPREWFTRALKRNKLSPGGANPSVNAFKIKSRLSLQMWRKNKWVPVNSEDKDVRGWFQWYCRYWIGRRQPEVDKIQIKRWRAFVRHQGAILTSYRRGPKPRTVAEKRHHRPKQRQALLQWAYDPYV